jgi:penicillin-binding protein 1A
MNFSNKGTADKQQQIKSKSKKYATKASVTFFRTLLICFVVLAIVGSFATFGILKGLIDNSPSIDSIDVAPSGFATTIYDNEGNKIQKLVGSDANRVYVELDQIPEVVQNAFIAIEDSRFWEHNGIDVKGIFRAFYNGIVKKNFDEGASTLTQQLLKNQVFEGGNEISFISKAERKIQEQYLAIQLEETLSKEKILEYYLNTINLSQNTLGVQAASNRYFNKTVSDLTLSEATVIAGITQNPAGLNPITHPEANADKRLVILSYMKDQGYIDETQYDEAVNDDVYARIQLVNEEEFSKVSTINSYFVDETVEQVVKDLQDKLGYSDSEAYNLLYRGGLSIYSTQKPSLQKICDEVLLDESLYPQASELALSYRLSIVDESGEEHHYSEQSLEAYFVAQTGNKNFDLHFNEESEATPFIEEYKASVLKKNETVSGETISFVIQPQVSFVLMNQFTGEVEAIVGGRGEKSGSRTLNRATNTVRQPGSTFKIVSTYLPALDSAGMTLATVFDDAEYTYPGTKVKVRNWNGEKYQGLTTIREAIYNSMNIMAVKTLSSVTLPVMYDYLLKLGFTTLADNYELNGKIYSDIQYPTALGGLTKGVSNLELTASFATIANKGVYTKPIFYSKIVDHDGKVLIDNSPQTRQVIYESTAWLLTNAMEDVITLGTGKQIKFKNSDMPIAGKTGTTSDDNDSWFVGYTPYYTAGIWGGYDNNKEQSNTTYTQVLWRTIMEKIHKDLDKKEFVKPDSIVSAKICAKSGNLAVEGVCNEVKTEYFASGTAPTEKCSTCIRLNICSESGKLANEFCPEGSVKEKVYLIKDETSKTADTPNVLPKGLEDSSCDIHTEKSKNIKDVLKDIFKNPFSHDNSNQSNDNNNNNNDNNTVTPPPTTTPTIPPPQTPNSGE